MTQVLLTKHANALPRILWLLPLSLTLGGVILQTATFDSRYGTTGFSLGWVSAISAIFIGHGCFSKGKGESAGFRYLVGTGLAAGYLSAVFSPIVAYGLPFLAEWVRGD